MARHGRSAVSKETEAVRGAGQVVIVGGVDYDQSEVKAAVFDPSSGRWSRAAWWRFSYSAVGAGGEVILWGGCCGPGGRSSRTAGAVYDIARDEWRHIHPGPLVNRFQHTAVWTGGRLDRQRDDRLGRFKTPGGRG